MKIKHSKLRNTGLLFELLVRQITTDALNNKSSKAIDIIKKYYHDTELSKEYNLYNSLSSAKNLSEQKAEFLINSALESSRKLDEKKLSNQKYRLVSEIKKNFNIDDFLNAKIENYKTIASIYMLFEMDRSKEVNDPNRLSDFKMSILESAIKKPEEKKEEEEKLMEDYYSYDKGTRELVYQLTVMKFNEKYENFNDKQKKLLTEYINNISTAEKLKEYVNKEFDEVKNTMTNILLNESNEVRQVKLTEVNSFIHPIADNKSVTEKDIHNLLYYYELIKEYEDKGK